MTTSQPRARVTDPSTSHSAAASVLNVTETQYAILLLLDETALTDAELVEAYHQAWFRDPELFPRASDSGIRSRRAELVALGLVRDTGQRRLTPSGRRAIVWS